MCKWYWIAYKSARHEKALDRGHIEQITKSYSFLILHKKNQPLEAEALVGAESQ